MHRHPWLAALPLAITATTASAQIVEETVVYEIDGQPFEGHFARNAGFGDSQPLVLIIHDWDGLGEYEKQRARMLAERGYAAFAVDVYGQGVRPETTEDKQARSGELYADRETLRQRLEAGLEQGRAQAGIDPARVVAIGYCFGGASVLEFARAGAELDGFVSLHGGLATPEGQDYTAVQGPLLILHGTNDPVAPMTEVAALAGELDAAGVPYDMELYGGAKHAFTVWGASGGAVAYDPHADVQSWDTMLDFFETRLR